MVVRTIIDAGGVPYYVGGYVRDAVMGIRGNDIDIEVFGMTLGAVESALSKFRPSRAGTAFGVLKLTTLDIDVSVPRLDNKIGKGHKGFTVNFCPEISLHDAAARRDFTMNTMYMNPETREIIDPYGGMDDIRQHILRPVSDKFADDPLRVLRGMQFCGRFEMFASPELVTAAAAIRGEYCTLPLERVWSEWYKWAVKSVRPSMGISYLMDVEWLALYPELYSIVDTPQDSRYHPEGTVWEHTLQSVDRAACIARREGLTDTDTAILVLAALVHDSGKGTTTQIDNDGRISCIGHELASRIHARSFMTRIGAPSNIADAVVTLAANHMRHIGATQKSVSRIARDAMPSSVYVLSLLAEVDYSARNDPSAEMPDSAINMLAYAAELNATIIPPADMLQGRDLIAMGMQPSPEFGAILRNARAAQDEGIIYDHASSVKWLQNICHIN